MMKCTAPKVVDGEGGGPGVFPRSGQVTLHLGYTGEIGDGKEGICGGGISP